VEGAGAGGVVVGKERKPVIFAMPKPKAVDKLSAQVHVLLFFLFLTFTSFFHKPKVADKVSAQVQVFGFSSRTQTQTKLNLS
jgi:hypothetical protein